MISFKVLTKRERFLLYFTVGIISFAVVFNFILAPIIERFNKLNQEIASTSVKLERYLRLLSEKEKIKNSYSKITSYAKIEGSEEEILAIILNELENLSRQAGLHITDVRPQVTRDIGVYRELNIELKQEGEIEGFLKFIYDLENSSHLLRIKRLQLNSKVAGQFLEGNLLVSKIFLP
jgi:Tfp pilus assembly protein PilO